MKKLVKIVHYYSDGTYEEFFPATATAPEEPKEPRQQPEVPKSVVPVQIGAPETDSAPPSKKMQYIYSTLARAKVLMYQQGQTLNRRLIAKILSQSIALSAAEFGVRVQTINDKLVRCSKPDLTISYYYDLLEQWAQGNPEPLRDFMMEYCVTGRSYNADVKLVEKLFSE